MREACEQVVQGAERVAAVDGELNTREKELVAELRNRCRLRP
ncbi:hypothetical protein ABII15_36760 [Streptomyces sp. HUAS MG91]|uniref:TerB family tellurite resistance protein n=1 Tax=Streptomyces tabacisoli TaxID=3156398 RepID=A0AAU8J4N6_9ACTN